MYMLCTNLTGFFPSIQETKNDPTLFFVTLVVENSCFWCRYNCLQSSFFFSRVRDHLYDAYAKMASHAYFSTLYDNKSNVIINYSRLNIFFAAFACSCGCYNCFHHTHIHPKCSHSQLNSPDPCVKFCGTQQQQQKHRRPRQKNSTFSVNIPYINRLAQFVVGENGHLLNCTWQNNKKKQGERRIRQNQKIGWENWTEIMW